MKAQTNSVPFTDTDLRVYAAVRRLKKTRVLELSREVKLAKSTVQGALFRLEQRGLVTKTIHHGVPLIRARGASNTLRSLEASRRRLTERYAGQNKLLVKAIDGLKRAQDTAGKHRQPSRPGKR